MVQFRPAAVRGQYDPPVVEDFSQAMSADMQRKDCNYNKALINKQKKHFNKKYRMLSTPLRMMLLLKCLAQFSKTAAEYVQKNAEQTAKDIQDGQDWDFMFGADNPATNLAEEVASEAAPCSSLRPRQQLISSITIRHPCR